LANNKEDKRKNFFKRVSQNISQTKGGAMMKKQKIVELKQSFYMFFSGLAMLLFVMYRSELFHYNYDIFWFEIACIAILEASLVLIMAGFFSFLIAIAPSCNCWKCQYLKRITG
jgi:hypothetical protein